MDITNNNYFDPEVEKAYFGTSQLKGFLDCEARTLAQMNGEWTPEMSTALLVGSYVDAYFEGTLDEFKQNHPQIFTNKGTLRADYVKADEIIKRVEQDHLFMEYMSGEKQKVMTGEIDGFPFKIKMDSYHPRDKIVDLKCMRSTERIMGKSFIEHWDYFVQAYIYKKIEGNDLPFYLAVATKEDEPDIEIIRLEEDDIEESFKKYRNNLQRWSDIKAGKIEPKRCGRCAYCRHTKKLTEPISSDLVGFSNKELEAISI